MAKLKKEKFVDDGQTIADMNVKGMPWYQSPETIKKKEEMINLNVSKKERRAMMKGALIAYLPMFIVIIVCFSAIFLAFYFKYKP